MMTTTASFPAGSVADCTETLALFYNTGLFGCFPSVTHGPRLSHAVRVPESVTRAECLAPPGSI